jgi:hypothetical protein
MANDYRHMYEFQFKSIYSVRKAMEEAAGLEDGARSGMLDTFYQRYRRKMGGCFRQHCRCGPIREDLSRAVKTLCARRK